MKLPDGERAIVDNSKLVDYVLNPTHPVGRHHAQLFQQLLGITRRNREMLKDALLMAARDSDVIPGRSSKFGQKYETRFKMAGPAGEKTVLAVWLIEAGADRPRLITCYVECADAV